ATSPCWRAAAALWASSALYSAMWAFGKLDRNTRLVGVVFGGRSGASRNRHMRKLLTKATKKATMIADSKPPSKMVAPRADDRPQPAIYIAANKTPNSLHQQINNQFDNQWSDQASLLRTYGKIDQPKKNKNHQHQPNRSSLKWAIQVGAYSRKRDAELASQRARHALGVIGELLSHRIIKTRDSRYYRARLYGLQPTSAQTACKILRKHKIDCFAISPKKNKAPKSS
ncbi:MAG: SPOR domain-containing protein, partial [Pseudomonadota bacterium]